MSKKKNKPKKNNKANANNITIDRTIIDESSIDRNEDNDDNSSSTEAAAPRKKIRLKDLIKDNRIYLISAVIITILFFICLALAKSYPLGTFPAIRGDGLEQLYAKHVENIHEIKKHGLPYHNTFSTGGFLNMYGYRVYDIVFPWLTLKYYLIPESLILLDFTFSLLYNLILSSITIIFFLTHRKDSRFEKTDIRLIPISLIYTLCSYNLIMFSYELFKYSSYLPLIILGLEWLVYENKKALYVVMLVLLMLHSPYHAFILCEFITLYFLTLNYGSIKDMLLKGLRFALYSIAAAGISAFYIIPVFLMTTSSAYKEQDLSSPTVLGFFNNFLDYFKNYRMMNNIDAISSDRGQAIIYAGLFMFFILPMFILCRDIKLSDRIKRCILMAVIFLAFNNEFLNYVMHGFHMQTMVPNRFAIFFVFLGVTMLADVSQHVESLSSLKVLLSIVIPSIILTVLYITNLDMPQVSMITSLVFLAVYILWAIICKAIRIESTDLFKAMLFIAAVEIIVNCIYIFPKQLTGTSTIIEDAKQIDSIADQYPEMKRFDTLTEYMGDHPDYHNLGEMTEINTLSYFASDYTADVMNRMKFYNLAVGTNNLNYYGGNPLSNMMLGVRYHIADKGDISPYSVYGKAEDFEDYEIYENPNYVGFGFVVDVKDNIDINATKTSTESDDSILELVGNVSDYENPFEYQNAISKALGGNDIYLDIPCEELDESKEYDEESFFVVAPESYEFSGDVYRNLLFHLGGSQCGNVYTYTKDEIYFIGFVTPDNRDVYFNYTAKELAEMNNSPHVAILDTEALAQLHDILAADSLKNVDYINNSITATLDSSKEGMLYISLPYYESWDIYIDDEKVEKTRFLGGIGVPITTGNHTLKMKYHTAGVTPGLIITLITLLLVLIRQGTVLRLNNKTENHPLSFRRGS
ncbi:Uncharacterized membrane protein YfhO [Lachnospiraceae bacterium NE2001]|nr:Uncharacterized membrane protein YfhO [Lachnospiraceae bacterium NE2001]